MYKAEYSPLERPKASEPKRKFTFRYGIYSTKATYVEEDHLLPADEFQRVIYDTPTTVGRNDTHWNPSVGGMMRAIRETTTAFIYTPSTNHLALL
jgi:hypothetical protein